jgi:hypothetical protein
MSEGDPPYSTCTQCRGAYPQRMMNDAGVCARCLMPAIIVPPNPIFTEAIPE